MHLTFHRQVYESLKTRFIPNYIASQGPQHAPQHAFFSKTTLLYTLCSMGACTTSTVITNPVDIVQTRWQTSGGKITSDGLSKSKEGTLKDIARHLWQQGGPKAFMRGVSVRVSYALPANAIGMTVYESLKRYGAAWRQRRSESASGTSDS